MASNISGLPSMSRQSTPRTMSSRLMTMKFMQRGVSSEGSSPTVTTPRSDSDGSAKRRKVAHQHGLAAESPATPLYDQKAVHAALEEEERKRQAAIERQALALGDSRWVLDAHVPASAGGAPRAAPLNVVQVGFAQIDSPSVPGNGAGGAGPEAAADRGTFRRFNMKKSKTASNLPLSDTSDGSDSDGSESDSAASPSTRGRSGDRPGAGASVEKQKRSGSLSKRRTEERLRAQKLAEKRRQKEVKLNKLTSISGSGVARLPASAKCFTCGKPGHKASECTRKSSR